MEDNKVMNTEKNVSNEKVRIKKYLEKPLTRKQKRLRKKTENKYERAYKRRSFNESERKTFQIKLLVGLLALLAGILLFKFVITINIAESLLFLLKPSIVLSLAVILVSVVLLFMDNTRGPASADPITDFFIINRGRIGARTRNNHLNKINTRFMMVTLMKLFRKDQIAIIDERIIYGTMSDDLSKDELALINFMRDHNITNLDDFVEILTEKQGRGLLAKKDHFYSHYKDAILEMATDKYYINRSISKAKIILNTTGIIFGLVAFALLATGQGSLEMLGIYSLQALVLLFMGQSVYAHSRGALKRVSTLRKEKRVLISSKAEVYTCFIYNYIFNKEERGLKRIQKMFQAGQMSKHDYMKFSETYNGFNYILAQIQKEN